jgi:protein-S-isoprenylcysteine O-methyltransferase Ste14
VTILGRTAADLLLLGVAVAELILLFFLTPTFGIPDWIYVSQHFVVFAIALTRRPPEAQDRSLPSSLAVLVAYTYPYAQVIYLARVPGEAAWPGRGIVLIVLGALLSFTSLVTLGRSFGNRPALRTLRTIGPYRLVRHPMYLSYLLADIGYNLEEWNVGTVVLVLIGWTALVFRIRAEERILSRDPEWSKYATLVRSRLLPGLW